MPSVLTLRRVGVVMLSAAALSWTGVSAASASDDDRVPTVPRCWEIQTYTPPPASQPSVEFCIPI
jgi:hypothetical protein